MHKSSWAASLSPVSKRNSHHRLFLVTQCNLIFVKQQLQERLILELLPQNTFWSWLKLSKCSLHFTGKSGSADGHVTWSNDLVDLFGHWLTSNSLIHWLAVNLPSRHHYSSLTLHWWTMSTYSPSKDIVSDQKYSLSKRTHSDQSLQKAKQLHHKSVSCCHLSCNSPLYILEEKGVAGHTNTLVKRIFRQHCSQWNT